MKLIILHLLFLVVLSIGCSDHTQERVKLLNDRIAQTLIHSEKFDSLINEINQLPSSQRIECIIDISYRQEKIDGVLKQEKLLYDIIPIASKKKRKEILLRIIAIYNEKDRILYFTSNIKCLKIIDKLEQEYSLTQEERWNLDKIKADLFNKQGKQKEYFSILHRLLKEHRAFNKKFLIIEDYCAIANLFGRIGNKEKAISFYKEAYQLSIDNQQPEFATKCVLPLTKLLYDNKNYEEAISYCKDTTLFYNILISCYLELNKSDSARLILNKKASRERDYILNNLQMAETYILEGNKDSAFTFTKKAEKIVESRIRHNQKSNQKFSYPPNFLQTYYKYAELLQRNGEIKQAQETYKLLEPLMEEDIPILNWKEKQIKAINSYSLFCRKTKQYEKALDLLALRDSLQYVYNAMKEEQEKTNIIHQFEVEELNYKIDIQDIELGHSKKLNVILTFTGLVVASLIIMIVLLFKNRRGFILKLYEKHEKLKKLEEKPKEIVEEEITPSKALFIKVESKMMEDKLFLRNDLTVDVLSGILNSNRTYVSGCVNEHKGKSFSLWINDLRIDYAIKLMHDDTTIDTKKMAQQCGFSTNETFYANFKQRCGVKPSQYLDQIIIKQRQG